MNLFKQAFDKIKENQEREFNCISWSEKLPRFSEYMPGISKKTYYAITAAPGAGKTQFVDNMFLYHAIDFAIAHNIDLEIVYFSFEISGHSKLIHGISKRLFDAYGSRVTPNQLEKRTKHKLEEHQLSKISKCEQYFNLVEKYLTVYDDPLTPSQIYAIQEGVMKSNGVYDPQSGVYTPNNPDKYVMFITDHIGLIQPDKGQSLHQALTDFSNNNVHLRNKFDATIVNIHQQNVDGQVHQFTTKGVNIAAKVEPKMFNLGDNRTLGRDYDVILGLFSPKSYEIGFHRGYKTEKFGDNCRFLSILKNRQGSPDQHVCMYFDGAVGYFEEMPKYGDFIIEKGQVKLDNDKLYEKYIHGRVGILDSEKQRIFNF